MPDTQAEDEDRGNASSLQAMIKSAASKQASVMRGHQPKNELRPQPLAAPIGMPCPHVRQVQVAIEHMGATGLRYLDHLGSLCRFSTDAVCRRTEQVFHGRSLHNLVNQPTLLDATRYAMQLVPTKDYDLGSAQGSAHERVAATQNCGARGIATTV